ncbi:MAG: dihydroorotase [Myxococcales bacterium]|nr:dihydroorotase [Myxococcales bacterium]
MIVRGARCVTPEGIVDADLGVRDCEIVAFGDLRDAPCIGTFDARGLYVFPGMIDPQVHFREPGFPDKEDLESGTRAAVLGGVSSVFEMPNTLPPTTSQEAFADKWKRAAGRVWCDIAFFVGATPENAHLLAELEAQPGCAGVKIFMGKSTGNLLVHRDEDLANVLQHGSRRVAVHAEDEERLAERKAWIRAGDVSSHPVWRDPETALRATRRLLRLAREAGRRVHVLHVTTEAETELLAQHRDIATFECTPQHLTLEAPACYRQLGSLAQMNPPIREGRHRAALWRALRRGDLDALGSDHAPHTRSEKEAPYPDSPSGMTGVQTMLPLMLDHVNRGALSLPRIAELLCRGPARVYGALRKGELAPGYDADLTLVDLGKRKQVRDAEIASRCGWSPFAGRWLTGWPVATFLRGKLVMRDGEILGAPRGRPVQFEETHAQASPRGASSRGTEDG